MKHTYSPTTWEKIAKLFMMFISVVGWITIIYQGYTIHEFTSSFLILFLFILFISITEYYPIPVWKGFTTVNFPLIFVMHLIYGTSVTVITYAFILVIVCALQKRPFRIIIFNPAQLCLSFIIAIELTDYLSTLFQLESISNVVLSGCIHYTLLLALYYLINNMIVDIVLLLRPQPYPFTTWKHKVISEMNSAFISFIYGVLLYMLGNQNRGEIDIFSYFFFFSPLIAISLIGSSFIRIKTEKNRLKSLFHLTKELNKNVLKDNGIDIFLIHFKQVLFYDELILLTRKKEDWQIELEDMKSDKTTLKQDVFEALNTFEKISYFKNKSMDTGGPLSLIFHPDMKSIIYVPLLMENELIGLLVVARTRNDSFVEGDINALATISNQLAAILKTRKLIKDKEQRNILEERNRIARNIHDGIAQNLAGAVLNLETAQKKWERSPTDSYLLVEDCIEKLRHSLWEVRNSIYALKPTSEKNVGLIPAMTKRIEEFSKNEQIQITLKIKGKYYTLSSMVERILFDTFQEAVQNSLKHSEANHIEVLLSYQKENIFMKVKDDGKGFSLFHAMIKAQNSPHFGIIQMNESAEKINASLRIDSKEEKGTEVTLLVPRLGMEGVN
ncbi:GAF domain-containing sensor histidine kinase [Metabacillus herbersteinensis]|uniref:histidine kinase n=1 Tax=Metabacillus herbersteinensis TaxID=283816 RepID=A0ABV6GH92_9BACI